MLHSTIYTIGTGGNINKLFKLSNQKFNQSISLAELRALNAYVREYSLEERVRKLKMNPDRADVIIPASLIYIELMKIVESDQMFVPGVGLKDGLLYQLFESTAKVNVKNIQFLGSFGRFKVEAKERFYYSLAFSVLEHRLFHLRSDEKRHWIQIWAIFFNH